MVGWQAVAGKTLGGFRVKMDALGRQEEGSGGKGREGMVAEEGRFGRKVGEGQVPPEGGPAWMEDNLPSMRHTYTSSHPVLCL